MSYKQIGIYMVNIRHNPKHCSFYTATFFICRLQMVMDFMSYQVVSELFGNHFLHYFTYKWDVTYWSTVFQVVYIQLILLEKWSDLSQLEGVWEHYTG